MITTENIYQKIQQSTGKVPTNCQCTKCQSLCRNPCIGTPEDMEKIVNAGFSDRVAPTIWAAGVFYGIDKKPISLIAPRFDREKQACTFFTAGKCELHELGLKPTEGKLAIHETEYFDTKEEFKQKSIAWNVAQEWL